jgi:hypothetical protein
VAISQVTAISVGFLDNIRVLAQILPPVPHLLHLWVTCYQSSKVHAVSQYDQGESATIVLDTEQHGAESLAYEWQ